jgi:hypothetical protein
LISGKRFSLLSWAEGEVFGDGSGEKVSTLHDHSDTTPELARRDFARVLTIKPHCPAGGLVQPVQHPEQRAFAGAAWPDDRDYFTAV